MLKNCLQSKIECVIEFLNELRKIDKIRGLLRIFSYVNRVVLSSLVFRMPGAMPLRYVLKFMS